MTMLTNCCKGLAAIALIAASPVFIIYAVPFACGLVGDLLNADGGPASLSITAGICLAALVWARYRARDAAPEAPVRRTAKSLGDGSPRELVRQVDG
ncbi:MAG TPA: hypothetical protein VHW66_20565 [Stellaceae bacterium]|jgi:hypothetical protein|nr:hypothetical protein [Stellaceae bacterium]